MLCAFTAPWQFVRYHSAFLHSFFPTLFALQRFAVLACFALSQRSHLCSAVTAAFCRSHSGLCSAGFCRSHSGLLPLSQRPSAALTAVFAQRASAALTAGFCRSHSGLLTTVPLSQRAFAITALSHLALSQRSTTCVRMVKPSLPARPCQVSAWGFRVKKFRV